jgi:hydrogenase maturation protein HypF
VSTPVIDAARAPGRVDRVRRRIVVTGIVQGVGFRPFVYVTATELGLSGSVTNDSAGVIIEAEGDDRAVAELMRRLALDHPPLARIDGLVASEIAETGVAGFAILESSHAGSGRTLASPDVATCPACLAELSDPSNRRFRHPFITCTNCGPRFTIILDLPYDRPTTTMANFVMCDACRAEYEDPLDRRFHAQTIACPDCGPKLTLIRPQRSAEAGDSAIVEARRMLVAGGILAVKGIGGYHLMCDATDESAVAELRRRKHRGDKPFAVMVADIEVARRYGEVDDREAALLESFARPVVLVRRRPPASGSAATGLAASVAPHVPDYGLMLAYTPVHRLLFGLPGDAPGPTALVATSGNISGEPIVSDDEEALSRLAPLVDGWLTHDRPIHVPCDDSVLRVVAGEQLPLRRGRGFAPLPIPLSVTMAPTLATGADLKNTCCLASGRQAWLSQHVGDMDDLATLRAFETTEALMESLTGVVPAQLVSDAHPAYRSSEWARLHAGGRAVEEVQHHHAHVASLMAECEVEPTEKVIGMAFDGTGYGTDGAVWGGEVLIADYAGFERFAHLKNVALPGGDVAVERPYRMALSHLHAAGIDWDLDLAPAAACAPGEMAVLAHQLRTGLGCVPTSSMGRLFDAVSSLCGVCQTAEYEAQAAIELEGLARGAAEVAWSADAYEFALDASGLRSGGAVVADPAPVIRRIVEDLRLGVSPSDVAVRFHGAVVGFVAATAVLARRSTGLDVVGLTGGVFQNPVLLARSQAALSESGFRVLRHRLVPPNDGGVALGQILVASQRSTPTGGPPCA